MSEKKRCPSMYGCWLAVFRKANWAAYLNGCCPAPSDP